MGIYSHKQHIESRQYKEAMAEKTKGAPVSKGWRTPYGFADFTEPVTYEEACAAMKGMAEKFFNQPEKETKNGR